jgi:molybdate transport system substrate-binding protein
LSVRRWLGVLALSATCMAQELTVAAASDLQAALPEVVTAFEKQSGKKVRVTFGSSGNFFAQIQNGAPFDVFLSADVDYPRRLVQAGLATESSLYRYAVGRIALWTPNDSKLDVSQGLPILKEAAVKRIAIANPAHAPYGRAARAALKEAGLWNAVQGKLVLGENISQAAQFVQTGNAQVGIIALSLAVSPRMTVAGRYWIVPQELHLTLEQAAVVMKASRRVDQAQAFIDFLKSGAGLAIIERYGFTVPKDQPK